MVTKMTIHSEQGDSTMDFRNFLQALRRHWKLLAAGTLTGLLVAVALSALTRPTYTAQTQLFVAVEGTGTVSELQDGDQFGQSRVRSYLGMVHSPIVLQPVIASLSLSESPDELAGRVKASAAPDTVLIDIFVEDRSPEQAAAVAQSVVASLVKAVGNLEKPELGNSSRVSLSVTNPASAPLTPTAPNTRSNVLLGLLIGFGLGLVVVYLKSRWENVVGGEADLRRATKAPLLTRVYLERDAAKSPIMAKSGPRSSRPESFRELRTNLQLGEIGDRSKIVLVTSSIRGEGRSTTAINLAIAIAEAGQSVCLVDADLRHPKVSDYLGLGRKEGLTNALESGGDVDELLQRWGDKGLVVLASGPVPPNPSEIAGSEEMKHLLEHLESQFDAVIIDTPQLIPYTDAAVLSQLGAGVVLVVGEQEVRLQDLERSLSALSLVGSNLVGVVLNRIAGSVPAFEFSADRRSDAPTANEDLTDNGRSRSASKTHGNSEPLPVVLASGQENERVGRASRM
jgi:capsular exopolysaccharide synthesis family protein